jgi:hypothetical protein
MVWRQNKIKSALFCLTVGKVKAHDLAETLPQTPSSAPPTELHPRGIMGLARSSHPAKGAFVQGSFTFSLLTEFSASMGVGNELSNPD